VNGKFTDPQRALYELVLEAQLAALNQVRPGNTWEDINNSAIEIITRGLIKLKIIQGSIHELDKWITDKAYKPFYMHTAGHWLGMDVHDVGNYKVANHWRPLEPGMCLTIEPGIYIAPGISGVDPKWHGIGIRIEDDVVVTTTGSKVLSSAVPKDIGAIEALMAG
ncbi:Xaa-Pro aminopeptidase, partial [Achromatium sp. WMS2]